MCSYLGGLRRVPRKAFVVQEEGVFVALPRFGFGNVLVLHHHRIPRLEDGLDRPLFPIVVTSPIGPDAREELTDFACSGSHLTPKNVSMGI
jgi:hypothetical protein